MPTKVLAVFANPRGSNTLRLGEENRVMEQCIKRSKNRSKFRLRSLHAATVDDLMRELLEDEYHIVHISGHGTGRGLLFEDETGQPTVPSPMSLAEIFRAHSPPLECVILNCCYSIREGILTALGVPFTIAAETPLYDQSSIEFTRGFYDAVGAGRDISFAYGEGVRRCLAKNLDSLYLPRLLRREDIGNWPQEDLPIVLDSGQAYYRSEIKAQGLCKCQRKACVGHKEKVYCYFPIGLSRWVTTAGLYYRCYDQQILCPRCRKKHRRGHIGRLGYCLKPYKNQIRQSDD
jgi:CHAT domain